MSINESELSIAFAQELSQSSADSLAVWVHISEGGGGGLIDKDYLMGTLMFSPERLHEALTSLYDFGVVDVSESTGDWSLVGQIDEVEEINFNDVLCDVKDFIYNHELGLQSVH